MQENSSTGAMAKIREARRASMTRKHTDGMDEAATVAKFRDMFVYHPTTGKVHRRRKYELLGRDKSAAEVGHYRKAIDRMCVTIDYKVWRLTHVAWIVFTGKFPPASGIECIDGNNRNLRWTNLREYQGE